MTGQTNLMPKRRFKEFQNNRSWEKRELDSIYKKIRNAFVGTATPYYAEYGNFYLESNNVKDGKINRITEVFINDEFYEKQKDKWLHTGDLVMVQSGHVGHTAVIEEELDGTAAHALIMFQEYKEQIDPYFLNFQFQTREAKRKLENITTGNTIKHILASEMKKFEVIIPQIEEQNKIGTFFKVLDGIIALQQSKLEKTKSLKSAYLSEMFPAEGEREPKRRFAGFAQAWEQYKFIELLDVKDGIRRGPFGSALKKDLFVPKSDYVVYEQQNAIYDKWETRYNITKEKFDELHKFVLSEGDFIMSGAGTIGRIAKVPKGIKQGVFNQALIRFKINPELIDSNYFLEWIRSDNMQRKFTGANPGSAMTNLVPMSEVKEWVVSLPSLAEQQKIGEFFAELSDKIALHKVKLEKLQSIKKAYLNELFV